MSEVISQQLRASSNERADLSDGVSNLRIALLTNMIPPFRKLLFLEISRRCQHLRVFISTPTEPNRRWRMDWDGLDVQVQKSATIARRAGYSDERHYMHFPLDTIPALARFKPHAIISSELGFRTLSAVIHRILNPKSRLLTWVCVSELNQAHHSGTRRQFRKLITRKIDGFLVNGESGASFLRKLGVSERKIFVAPYPTDVERFGASQLERDEESSYRMLYVGRFVTGKGLMPFLQILYRWATQNPQMRIEFHLVGSGPLKQALGELPRPHNVWLSIREFVPYDQLPTVYQGAGVFVFPTLADEWGTVASEAMACGLPVLGSTASQAVEELVQEGITGWLFHPGREDEMYRAIDRCMKTPADQLSRMRIAARDAALRLSPQAMAEQVMEAVKASFAI